MAAIKPIKRADLRRMTVSMFESVFLRGIFAYYRIRLGSVQPETASTCGMDVKNRVAMRIRTIRKRRGLSQEDMAGLINRAPDTISNLERGVSLPTYETLDDLAKGLNVPLADFFLDEDADTATRAEAMARLTDAARQLNDEMLVTAAAIMEVLASNAKA